MRRDVDRDRGDAGHTGAPAEACRGVELGRSSAEMDAFVHEVAHDLQEPLRSIRLITQFLGEDLPGMDETTSARVAKLGSLAARAERMVSVLSEYARAGSAEIRRAPHPLSDIVRDAVEDLGALLAETGARVEMAGVLPVVECDRILTGQVLVHLIGDAARRNRSEPNRVEVGAVTDRGGPPEIFVRDNGAGIEPGAIRSVFRMFPRQEGASEFEAGGGLAIARRIVERHGGRIWVEFERGRGSTFFFTLSAS